MESFYFIFLVVSFVLIIFYAKKKKNIVVSDIIIYPVKGCNGVHLKSSQVGELGLSFDREWAICGPDNSIIDQLVEARLKNLVSNLEFNKKNEPEYLVLEYPSFTACKLKIENKNDSMFEIVVDKRKGLAINEGENVSNWLKSVFGKEYRLCKIVKQRRLNGNTDYDEKIWKDEHKLSFACEGQLLVVSQESYDYLIEKVPKYKQDDIDISNFRPNIILKNCKPFEEDNFEFWEINGVKFQGIRLCTRCRMTTISPNTLEYDSDCEPLKTLRKLHGTGTKGFFGLYSLRLNSGIISVDDKVEIKSMKLRKDDSII